LSLSKWAYERTLCPRSWDVSGRIKTIRLRESLDRAYFGGDDSNFEDEEIWVDFFSSIGKLDPPNNNKRRDVGHGLLN